MINKEKILQNKAYHYAKAILNIAMTCDVFGRFKQEFGLLKDRIASDANVRKYLEDPSIEKTEKIKAILKSLNKDATDLVKACAVMLVLLDAMSMCEQVYISFTELADKLKRQVFVEVISATGLDRSMISKIKNNIGSKTGLDVNIINTIDTNINDGIFIDPRHKKLHEKACYYAQSILDLSEADNAVNRIEEEFKQLKNEVVSNISLKEYLEDTSIKKTEKIKSVLKILRKDISKEIKAFTIALVLLDAVDIIEKIFFCFIELVDKFKKQVFVEVISAISLDKNMIERIKKRIDSKIGLNSRISNTIDKSIIGGIIIKFGDNLIDLSIKNKIEDLKTELKSIELRGEEFGSNNKVRQNN